MQIILNDNEYTLDDYVATDYDLNAPFLAYAKRVLIPFIRENCPHITLIHCQRSGFPYAAVNHSELEDMVTHVIVSAKYHKAFGPFDANSPAAVQSAVEDILDSLEVRALYQSRPAPSLAFANGTPAIASLPAPRQLSILLAYLLYNAKGLDRVTIDSELYLASIRATVQLAEFIQANWRSEAAPGSDAEKLQRLHAAVIELDAKYTLTKLKLGVKEASALEVLRAGARTGFNVDAVESFVIGLLVERDKTLEIDLVSPRRWTNTVFYNMVMDAPNRIKFSNLPVDKGPSNRHIKPTAESKPKAEPTTDKGKKSAANRAMFADILKEGL